MSTGQTFSFGTTASAGAPFVRPALTFQPTIANYFGYTPNLGFALSATILYTLTCIILTVLCIVFYRRKVLYFLVLPLVAGPMDCLSYALRAHMASSSALPEKWEFILSLVGLIIAPIFVALANYLLCGRIVRHVGVQYSLFRPVIIERFFVLSDVASFLVQGIGASVFAAATTSNAAQSVFNLAQAILIAGFVIQLAALVVFLATCITVDVRTRRHTDREISHGKWRRLFPALYVSVTLLLIRSIYRTIEFEAARGSDLATQINGNEWWFGVFETAAVFFAYAVFLPFHPGFYNLAEVPEATDGKVSPLPTAREEADAEIAA